MNGKTWKKLFSGYLTLNMKLGVKKTQLNSWFAKLSDFWQIDNEVINVNTNFDFDYVNYFPLFEYSRYPDSYKTDWNWVIYYFRNCTKVHVI